MLHLASGKLTRGEFFAWCLERGLPTDESVARVFSVTGQTVRNWRRELDAQVSRRVLLCVYGCLAWDAGPLAGSQPLFPRVGVEWLFAWAERRGLRTHREIGAEFGRGRQDVGRWRAAGVPEWLPLACVGVDWVRRNGLEIKESVE
jgi:hypothetical protein